MSKSISILVGAILIISVGGIVYWQTSDIPAAAQNTETNTQTNGGMTAADVATHADASSCWSIINGNVYDLTSWIPRHPGGPDAILKLCGVDGSERFNNQHGGSAPQEQTLAGFKVGTLSQ